MTVLTFTTENGTRIEIAGSLSMIQKVADAPAMDREGIADLAEYHLATADWWLGANETTAPKSTEWLRSKGGELINSLFAILAATEPSKYSITIARNAQKALYDLLESIRADLNLMTEGEIERLAIEGERRQDELIANYAARMGQ